MNILTFSMSHTGVGIPYVISFVAFSFVVDEGWPAAPLGAGVAEREWPAAPHGTRVADGLT